MVKTAERTPTGAGPVPGRPSRLPLLVVLVIAGVLVFLPTKQLIDQHRRIEGLEDRLALLQEENERLTREAERLDDPEELELEARERLGLVRPGERMYVLVPPEETPPPAPAPSSEGSVPQRIWTWFLDLVRGGGGGE